MGGIEANTIWFDSVGSEGDSGSEVDTLSIFHRYVRSTPSPFEYFLFASSYTVIMKVT